MANKTQTIRIESILGGHSPSEAFAAPDQFYDSIGIDPAGRAYSTGKPGGVLYPVGSTNNKQCADAPLWMVNSPKGGAVSSYAYDAAGSVYSRSVLNNNWSSLGDLNDGGSATGNGSAYYDNYMYFARDTTIARYGPLDGTPAFTDDFWVNTLGLTALSNPTYPYGLGPNYPNHVMHRHSDGRLYVADVVDGQGTLHYIQTTKTTVEGDTNAGSKYDALNLGYGLWITAMESYGDTLVFALWEGSETRASVRSAPVRAKLAFWDTTSDKINSITWVEFPDPIIGSIRNVNGVLYIASGYPANNGFRLSRYIGGNSVEQLFLSEDGNVPYPQGMIGTANRVLIGSYSNNLESSLSVYSYGLNMNTGQNAIFNIMSMDIYSGTVTCLGLVDENITDRPDIGWTTGSSGLGFNGIAQEDFANYDTSLCYWFSQMYRIGQPFKITKIRIPLTQVLNSGMSVIPSVYVDDFRTQDETVLTTINSTNFGTEKRSIVLRPENLTGENSFILKLQWEGTAQCKVALPITIEYELIDD